MRPIDILILVVCALIVFVIGIAPLLRPDDRTMTIVRECTRFYGPSGSEAVELCIREMTLRGGGSVSP